MTSGVLGIALWLAYAQVQSGDGQSEPQYVAFRREKRPSANEYDKVVKSLGSMGVETLRNESLSYHGIIVFKSPSEPQRLRTTSQALSRFKPIPIQNFRGVLSVYSGRIYVQFNETVTADQAKSRLLRAGFRILTTPFDARFLVAVEKSKKPELKQREVETLQQLPDVRYVTPDDIPLPVRPPAYKGYRPIPQQ